MNHLIKKVIVKNSDVHNLHIRKLNNAGEKIANEIPLSCHGIIVLCVWDILRNKGTFSRHIVKW